MEVDELKSTQAPDVYMLNRQRMAYDLFDELNKNVFENRLKKADMVWSRRMKYTAGRWVRDRSGNGGKLILSSQMLSDVLRLFETLAYVMCRMAACHRSDDTTKKLRWQMFAAKVMEKYQNSKIVQQVYKWDRQLKYTCLECANVHRVQNHDMYRKIKCSCGGVLIYDNKTN